VPFLATILSLESEIDIKKSRRSTLVPQQAISAPDSASNCTVALTFMCAHITQGLREENLAAHITLDVIAIQMTFNESRQLA
jgi:hypothetical protein